MPASLTKSAGFVALGFATVAHAQKIIYVDASNTAVGDGQSWNTAFSNLQIALSTINGQPIRNTVEFRIAGGRYTPDVLSVSGSGFTVSPAATASAVALTIKGGYMGRQSPTPNSRDFVSAATILSGDRLNNDSADATSRDDNARSVVFVAVTGEWTSVTLDGLTIRDGFGGAGLSSTAPWTWDSGGGIHVLLGADNGRFELKNCVVTQNEASFGGGVYLRHTSVGLPEVDIAFSSCTLSNNRADSSGGAVYTTWFNAFPPTPVQIDRCSIEGNAADSGAGLSSRYRDYAITNSSIRGNVAQQSGGGLYLTSAGASLTNSLLADNHARGSAGAYATWFTCLNTTVANNSAQSTPGLFADWIELTNCVFGANTSTEDRGDLGVRDSLLLDHTAITLHFNPNGSLFGGGTLSPESSHRFTFDPGFIDPDGPDNDASTWIDNNYRLQPRSLAVDNATFQSTLSIVDIAGNPRFVSGIIGRPPTLDLGCYESQLTLCPADLTADNAVTIDDLLDFLSHFEQGQPLADLTTNGSTPFPDGGVTIDDLLFFLLKFEQGC